MKKEIYPVSETFSFSRALHLMRYAGAKVRGVHFKNGEYYYISQGNEGSVLRYATISGKTGKRTHYRLVALNANDVIGDWEIYREELHGVQS